MSELVHERRLLLEDSDGIIYDCARVYAAPQRGGTWRGFISFEPTDGGPAVETGLETTQSTAEGVAYWATGLEPVYFEGALQRALHRDAVPPIAASVPAVAIGAAGAVDFVVEGLEPDLPLRLMGTRTLFPGLQRRIHNGGLLVYQGSPRDGAYEFVAQFASENAAALLANTLWSELHGTGAVLKVAGTEVVMRNGAIKEALTGALVR